jgi:hypothetical protein
MSYQELDEIKEDENHIDPIFKGIIRQSFELGKAHRKPKFIDKVVVETYLLSLKKSLPISEGRGLSVIKIIRF